jgi:hypothetical protein
LKQKHNVSLSKVAFKFDLRRHTKELCRKLGVVKLPYFHIYNGSGSRLADFSASLDPAKFARISDAIAENRASRCSLKGPEEVEAGAGGRGLPSSTFRLNSGAFCRIGVHLGVVQGVFRRCQGVLRNLMRCSGCISCQKRIRLS